MNHGQKSEFVLLGVNDSLSVDSTDAPTGQHEARNWAHLDKQMEEHQVATDAVESHPLDAMMMAGTDLTMEHDSESANMNMVFVMRCCSFVD